MPETILRMQRGIGFLGSDTFNGLQDDRREQLQFTGIIQTGIRFALCAALEDTERVRQKIKDRASMVIATSYPMQVVRIAEEIGLDVSEVITLGGSVEVAPYVLNEVDAIVDAVESGRTLDENGMSIIIDNLGTLAIGAVWRREKNEN